ncbi:MAG: T9SS type A sorting domain-containing protein [Ignavibacteria bacterium]|jgi:hypothetical protein|nr:T9SS type A sorting domain-containing protein [Ignavibacteria bacterium]MCU7501443.1 T9SS type A sorting domain-containing protein [Ignavibacteria bacterium]MCU7516041.1 T9SS type A sorting domain-containing protein [Ignavibacteria bacterium]
MKKALVQFAIITGLLLNLLSVAIYAKSTLTLAHPSAGGFFPGENPAMSDRVTVIKSSVQEESSAGTLLSGGALFPDTDSRADTLLSADTSEADPPIRKSGSQASLFASNTWIEVSAVSGPYTGTVNLSATLRKLIPPTSTISGRLISFTLDGRAVGSATTDKNGVARISDVRLPEDLNIGLHLGAIQADFAGDADYKKSSGSGLLTITYAPTTLTVDDVNAPYGSTVPIRARLISSLNGAGLADRVVTVLVNNLIRGMAVTDANGIASLDVDLGKMEMGTYPILVTFLQVVGNYSPNTASATLKVLEIPTSLVLSSSKGTYGDSARLEATLTSSGLPLKDKTINFTVNGNPAGSVKTSSDGSASLKFSLSGLNAGLYTGAIKAEFTAAGNYGASSATGDLTVDPAPTSIIVSDAAGTYAGKVSLSAAITTSPGIPLEGVAIYFKLNGEEKGSAITGVNGVAVLPEVSLAGISVGKYDSGIEAYFSPSGGNYAPSSGKGRLEVSLVPTSISIKKITATFGSKADLEATLTCYGVPLGGKPVEFMVNGIAVGSAVTDANGLAVKSCIDLTGISAGLHTDCISASFLEAEPYKGCSCKADLEITKASTSISLLHSQVQYSDEASLIATVTSGAQENLNKSGGSVEFKYQLGNGPVHKLETVCASGVVNGKLTFSYKFLCNLDPDSYKIFAFFRPNDQENFTGSCNPAPYGPLMVEPEDAIAEFSGEQYFSASSSGSASVIMSSAIMDTADSFRGDITKARVEFREAALGSLYNDWIIQATNLPVNLINASDMTNGNSTSQPYCRDLSQSEMSTSGVSFDVYTKVRGYYTKLSGPLLVTIGMPGDDVVSGGGFIVPKSPAGKYRAKSGARTDFGFTMRYDQSCKNAPGQASIIIRSEDGRIYQANSRTISSLSAYTIDNMPGKAAGFTAVADLIDVTDPFNQFTLSSGLSLAIEMYDDAKDHQTDAIAITLKGSGDTELLYSNNWDGSKTALQTFDKQKGLGTIKVLGSSVISAVEKDKLIPKEYALFQNYPNPFNPSTTIQYDLPENSRVKIAVYDVLGKEISQIVNGEVPAGRHQAVWNSQEHGSFASGIYIIRIAAESLSSKRSLISAKKMLLIK